MRKTLLGGLLLACGWLCVPLVSQASQLCGSDIVGVVPGGNGVASAPLYNTSCQWYAGAIAVDPVTRRFSAMWKDPDARHAWQWVQNQCGAQCVGGAFYGDFAWFAVSEDGRAYYMSQLSEQDAVNRCQAEGAGHCDVIVAASSTAAPLYWYFAALAYDVQSGATGSSSKQLRAADARADALRQCGKPTCQVYVFQTGEGALAVSSNGQLFTGRAPLDHKWFSGAAHQAEKGCEKETGDKNCKVVGEVKAW